MPSITSASGYVQSALGINNDDRTTILVAHRLTTLRDCDRILVLDQGRIVEEGTYDQLLLQGGLFTELSRSAEQGLCHKTPAPDHGQAPVTT